MKLPYMQALLEIVEENPEEALHFTADTIKTKTDRLHYLKKRFERQKNLETLLLHLKNHQFVSHNKVFLKQLLDSNIHLQRYMADNLVASLDLIKQGASQADRLDSIMMNLWIMETEFGISELIPLNKTEIIRQASEGIDSYSITDEFVVALSENNDTRVWDKIYTDGVIDIEGTVPHGHLYIGDDKISKGCAFRLRDASYVLWTSYSVKGTEKLQKNKRTLYTNDLLLDISRLPDFDYVRPTFEFTDDVDKAFLGLGENCTNDTKYSFNLNIPQSANERPQVFYKK